VDRVIFFKDVDGLFDADPRRVPEATPLPMIPHDEAAHLGRSGARVLHPRSASLAERHGISIEIRNLASPRTGTLIASRDRIRTLKPEAKEIFAVNCLEGITQFTVEPEKTPPFPDFPQRLLESLAAAGISLDMINILEEKALFTVAESNGPHTRELIRAADCLFREHPSCAKISLLGGGIHGVPGIMSKIIAALAEVGVPVLQSVDTYTVISVLVAAEHATASVRALHKAFITRS
jgi:aspartate kinase